MHELVCLVRSDKAKPLFFGPWPSRSVWFEIRAIRASERVGARVDKDCATLRRVLMLRETAKDSAHAQLDPAPRRAKT
jgi:hypothetical protein